MAKNGDEHRRQLFELYSTNLQFFTAAAPGQFVCPICSQPFGPDSVVGPDPAVNIAHVYPQAVGGKLDTLTCAKCNGRMGTKYDAHLGIEHDLHDAVKAGRPVNGRVSFDGGDLGVKVVRHPHALHFQIVGEWTDPAMETALVSAMGEGEGFRFDLHYRFCEPARQQVALLHAAYLALFRDFGYEFIFAAKTKWIRDVLMTENPPSGDPHFVTIHIAADGSGDDRKMLNLTGVAEVHGVRCLVAVFPAADPANSMRCVLLPGLGAESQTAYAGLKERPDGPLTARFNLCPFPPAPRLADPNGSDYLRYLWSREFQ